MGEGSADLEPVRMWEPTILGAEHSMCGGQRL